MVKDKFKVGDWVCDIGDQSLGIEVVEIRADGMLIAEDKDLGITNCEVDPKLVEIWKK